MNRRSTGKRIPRANASPPQTPPDKPIFRTGEQNELPPLPQGWAWARLEDVGASEKNAIVDGPFGSNLKLTDYVENEKGVPVLTTKNLERGYDRKYLRFISHGKFEQLKRSQVRGGDILVAKIGSVGKCGIYPKNMPVAIIPANLLKITVHASLETLYFYYFLNSPAFREALEGITTATAQPAFNVSKFRKLFVPLSPLAEQQRIVIKIEELFSDLDAGVAALQKAKAQLKRYCQAVLKAAVEGKLTAEWREANKGKIEPASVVLERIRAERARKANGKSKPLPPVDAAELPELPEGWCWARVQEVCEKVQYGTSEKANHESSGIPVVRMGNIQRGRINFDAVKFLPEGSPRLNDFILEDGDVLFNRTNSAELVGKTAVYKRYYPRAIFASYLIRVKVRSDAYDPNMLSFFINSSYGRHYIGSVVSQQVGQANVNRTKLSQMPIPAPPLAEQQCIVAEVERRLSVADEIGSVLDQILKQAERLRQSILKRAFAGKLVPQDPNDGPAEELLERIKAARASANTSARIGGEQEVFKRAHKSRHTPVKNPRLL